LAIIIGIALVLGSVIWCAIKYKRYRIRKRNNNYSLSEIFDNQPPWRRPHLRQSNYHNQF
jgi:hypothetical protein